MITDFIDDRRPLVIGGVQFRVRRVSLSAILRVYQRVSEATLRELALQTGAEFNALKVLEHFGLERVAEILSWLMEPSDQALIAAALKADADTPLEYVAAVIQNMNDLPKITESFRLAAVEAVAPGNGKGAGGPGGLELMVDLVARRYGVPPHAVMEWPYEEVMAIVGVAEKEASLINPPADASPARRVVVGDGKVDASMISMLGGEYEAH